MTEDKQKDAEIALKKTQEKIDAEIAEDSKDNTSNDDEQSKADTHDGDEHESTEEDSSDETSEDDEESEEDEQEETESKPTQEQIDYKKKFSESSREAQKILAKNRKITQAIDDANEIPEPTEEELEKEFGDWDVMTDTEKRLAKEAIISKQYRERISRAREETKKIEKWSEEVDKFIDDPKTLTDTPELEGKVEEFKLFATEESNSSVPFKILVAAFLHEVNKNKPAKKKGKMMESGTGGPNDKGSKKGDTISLAEAENLRRTDYKKYKKFLTSGKIKIEVS